MYCADVVRHKLKSTEYKPVWIPEPAHTSIQGISLYYLFLQIVSSLSQRTNTIVPWTVILNFCPFALWTQKVHEMKGFHFMICFLIVSGKYDKGLRVV